MRLSIVASLEPANFAALPFRGDIERSMASAASLGYDGIELAIRDPGLADVDRLRSQLDAAGLALSAIGTGQAWGEDGLSLSSEDTDTRSAAIKRIKGHVSLAANFGAIVIIGLIRGHVPTGGSRSQTMKLLVESLTDCAAAAADLGVRLALEPINRYETNLVNTAEEGLDLARSVGAANVGLLLDTFHMNIEEPSIERTIEECAGRIIHFHVADSNRSHPGAGHLDFSTILSCLASTGYDGFVSGEFIPELDEQSAARATIRHLRFTLARL